MTTREGVRSAVPRTTLERSVEIEGHRVVMAVTVLPADERERMAASIAWFADAAMHQPAADAWHVFVDEVIGTHVSFTVDELRLVDLDAGWWTKAIRAATLAFVQINGLAAGLERSLQPPRLVRS